MNVTLRDQQGMYSLTLHASLFSGLASAAGFRADTRSLGTDEAAMLDDWADNSAENTVGQRADLARAVAGLLRVAGSVTVSRDTAASGGFWEAVSR